MKKIVILFLITLISSPGFSQLDFNVKKKFTREDTLRGTLSSLRSCYDILMYDLDVKVDIEKKFISGNNTIKFAVKKDFKKLQIDLFKNMNIEKIEFNDQQLKFIREFNAVVIEFPDTLKENTIQKFKVYYSGYPQVAKHAPWDGGFTWNEDGKNPFVGVSCQGTGASLWWPCKDHQSDEPLEMMIRVTVPPGLDEVSNGKLINKTILPDQWTKFEWHISYPINNYDVTLNIAKYKHLNETYHNKLFKDSLTLDYYVLPSNFEKAKKQFEQVKPMLDCYYKFFGEYPFVRDGYKLVEAPYLGMEHQSCIAYGNKYLNGYLGIDRSRTGYKFDYIIIHESAHEWWGNSITTNDIADMWVHEGFGTYAEALYIECLYGHNAYMEYINSEKNNTFNDSPVTGVYGVNDEGSGDMYPKGALLIHTIRSVINDDVKFFKILKGIQDTFKYTIVNSVDIENFISDKSGIDFSGIFDRYLHYAAIPKLQITYDSINNNDLKITYRFDLPATSSFAMPVQITTQKGIYGFIIPTSKNQTMILKNMKPKDLKVATDLFYIDSEIKEVSHQEADPVRYFNKSK